MKNKDTISGLLWGIFLSFLLIGNILNYLLN